MTVCLCVLDAAGRPTGETFPFDSHACFVFGRDADAQCRITDDPAVSRHHFMLEVVPPDARVKDLGSTNGIHVNGVHFGGKAGRRNPDGTAAVVALHHGDRIRVGKTQIEVRIRLPATEPATFREGIDKTAPLDPSARTAALSGTGRGAAAEDSVGAGGEVGRPSKGLVGALNARVAAADRRPGIPGYELGERLGQGGMGIVYRATRSSDGAELALKVLSAEVDFHSRRAIMFRREIAVIRSLTHENIVAFVDAGQADGRMFLVMEYLTGGNLARRIAGNGPVPPAVAVPWMRQMAAGLAAAHRRDLVHRDLKPGNILLDGPGDGARVKIADFGLAKSLLTAGLSGFTATGMGAGTAACMPPEQLKDFKRATKAADVFSMGATFYEMLAGRSPYNFDGSKEHVATILAFDLTPLSKRRPGLPGTLTAMVDRCLQADPSRRFADGGELEAHLPA